MSDWAALAARASMASHDLVGWIFWDPTAIANYARLGVPDGMGYYAAVRFGPIAGAGNDVCGAVGYSINPVFLGMGLDLCRQHTEFESAMRARDDAVVPGLAVIDPQLPERLAALGSDLWRAVDELPASGRAFFAAHRERPRPGPAEAALSAWLAVNCLREWRGDTHWALCVAHDLDAAEVGLLHNALVDGPDVEGYEDNEWIARSRGVDDAGIERGWSRLNAKGLADGKQINERARELRRAMEERTDEISGQMWELVGEAETVALCELAEPHHDAFLARIDATAGPNWMPAARMPR